jgi:hypothetical protein
MAGLAHSLQVRLIKEEALIAAMLVDILPGSDNVVDNSAQYQRSVDRVDHAEGIPSQNYPANRSPYLRLVEPADRIVRPFSIESFSTLHGIDGIRPEGSNWQLGRPLSG